MSVYHVKPDKYEQQMRDINAAAMKQLVAPAKMTKIQASQWAWLRQIQAMGTIDVRPPINLKHPTKLDGYGSGTIYRDEVNSQTNPLIKQILATTGVYSVSFHGWRVKRDKGKLVRLKIQLGSVAYPIEGFPFPDVILTVDEGVENERTLSVGKTKQGEVKLLVAAQLHVKTRGVYADGNVYYDNVLNIANTQPLFSQVVVMDWWDVVPDPSEIDQAVQIALPALLRHVQQTQAWVDNNPRKVREATLNRCYTLAGYGPRFIMKIVQQMLKLFEAPDDPKFQQIVAKLTAQELQGIE